MSYRRKPIVDKKTTSIINNGFKSVSCSMQGWRKNMEDSHSMTVLPSGILIYGVYDGHGGEEVAEFVSRYLPQVFKDLKQDFTNDEIKNGFIELDKMLIKNGNEILNFAHNKKKSRDSLFKSRMLEYKRDYPEMSPEDITKELVCDYTGSTATVVFIDNDRIVTATLGDCQGVIYRNTGESIDLHKCLHNLDNEVESDRVKKAGLEVGGKPLRISRELAVSRSFGDYRFKKQGTPKLPEDQQPVSIIPDIMIHNRTNNDEFLLIGCDGIFDVFTSNIITNKIKKSLENEESIELALEKLLNDCLCPLDSEQELGKDNMTVLFVNLKKNSEIDINKRIQINSLLAMTPEQLSEYENFRFNELHGGC